MTCFAYLHFSFITALKGYELASVIPGLSQTFLSFMCQFVTLQLLQKLIITMDCQYKTEPIISEILTVVNGEIIKTRTVVTFLQSQINKVDEVTEFMEYMNIEENKKIDEYDSN